MKQNKQTTQFFKTFIKLALKQTWHINFSAFFTKLTFKVFLTQDNKDKNLTCSNLRRQPVQKQCSL